MPHAVVVLISERAIGSEVSFAVSRRPSAKSPTKGNDRNNRLINVRRFLLKIPLAGDYPRPPIVAEAISGRADARVPPVPTETRSERSGGGGRRALELLRSSRCDGRYYGVSCQGTPERVLVGRKAICFSRDIEVRKAACSPPKPEPRRLNSSFTRSARRFFRISAWP
jgi:hypothetical protein